MKIEFNPAGIAQSYASPIVSQENQTAPIRAGAAPITVLDAFKEQLSKLSQMSTVRPEQVAKAQALVADSGYPPDYVLKRIPILLGLVQRKLPGSTISS
jgi:hypothetical protein